MLYLDLDKVTTKKVNTLNICKDCYVIEELILGRCKKCDRENRVQRRNNYFRQMRAFRKLRQQSHDIS